MPDAEAVATAVRERIAASIGQDAVLPNDAAAAYQTSDKQPVIVVAPVNTEAAAATLALCSTEGWTVECAGAGTWLRPHRVPAEPAHVIVSTRRIAGINEYEPADLTIGSRAGTQIADLRWETAARGQALPLDPPSAPAATLGAVLAMGQAGPLLATHGTPRDQVLGIEVVTGDGRMLRFGGRVVKNVAGYDIVRLLIGSQGTLGLITAAHLRLRGLPERDSTLLAQAATMQPLLDVIPAIAALEPAALEIVHGVAADPADWILLTRFRGNVDGVEESVRRFQAILPHGRRLNPQQASAQWARLEAEERDANLLVRIRITPAAIADAITTALELAGPVDSLAAHWTLAAHATDGTVRLARCSRNDGGNGLDAADCARFAEEATRLRRRLAEDGGTLHLPVAPAAMPADFDPVPIPAELQPLMRRIHDAFDPAGILRGATFRY